MQFNPFYWLRLLRDAASLKQQLDRIENYQARLISQGEFMTAALTQGFADLRAKVTNLTTIDTSLVAQNKGIADLLRKAIDNAPNDAEALAAIKDIANNIDSQASADAAAVQANVDLFPGASTFAITSLSPSTVTAGGPDVTLVVNGTGFVSGSLVQADGGTKVTSFVANQLTAVLPAADIAQPKTIAISVLNPDGTSTSTSPFTVA